MSLREEGALVTIVGSDPSAPVRGKHGLEATADVGVDAVSADDVDASWSRGLGFLYRPRSFEATINEVQNSVAGARAVSASSELVLG
jgi:hypothetical protein